MGFGRLAQLALVVLALVLVGRAGQEQQPKSGFLVKSGDKNELVVVNRGERKVVGTTTATWLAWNPQGTRALLHAPPSGGLWVYREGRAEFVEVAKAAEQPRWSPDGAKVLFRTPAGELKVYIATVIGSDPLVVAKDVRCAEWSPDGSRIAYSSAGSIYICGADGENPRESVSGANALTLTWSPSGRALAYIEAAIGKGSKPNLTTAATNGTAVARKTVLEATSLSWSPGGKYVAAETASGVEVFDIETAKSLLTAAGMRSPVAWIGAKRLIGAKAGEVVEVSVDSTGVRTLAKLSEGTAIHAAIVPQLHLSEDLILEDPFRISPKPRNEQTALHGTVVAIDPIEEQFTVAVDSVAGTVGERHFTRPIEQKIQHDPKTQRILKDLVVPLRSIDIKIDDEVMVVVNATKLDEKAILAATSVTIAGDSIREPALKPSKTAPHISGEFIEYDGVSMEKVIVPMTFPVLGAVNYQDWFLAPRGGGTRRHHGQDLMAKKMQPLVAAFDGTVVVGKARPGGHMTLRIRGANGWTACYYHVNNDNPGTDDGSGGETFAFAPGLRTGQFVYEGQFIGFVGDSGNAETTAPHCHFELWDDRFGAVVNAYPSLRNASRLDEPRYIAPAPELIPAAGEARFDGIVRKLDDSKETLRMQLIARYDRGKMRVVTWPSSVWGKIESRSVLQVRGRKNAQMATKDLREGLLGTLVGPSPPKDRAIATRIGAFERP